MKTLILILALCFVTPVLAGPKQRKQHRKPSVSQRHQQRRQRIQKRKRIQRREWQRIQERQRQKRRRQQYRPYYYAPRHEPYYPPIYLGNGLYYFPDSGRVEYILRF